jgi:hypothetical protein
VRKLSIIILVAAAACAASPAAAQDNRRQNRSNCTEQNPCSERRGAYQWFYLGQDEGQRPTRRVVRRLALDD